MMRVGVPTEITGHEYHVGLIPAAVREVALHGHQVFVQSGAAARQGFCGDDYRKAGATIIETAAEVF